MTQWPPAAQLARRLFTQLAAEQRAEALPDLAERAHHQLRDRLTLVLGQAGFDALWSRALHQIQPGVENLSMLLDSLDSAQVNERIIASFEHCFALLAIFIGDELSFRLLQQTWPTVRFDASEPQAEEGHP